MASIDLFKCKQHFPIPALLPANYLIGQKYSPNHLLSIFNLLPNDTDSVLGVSLQVQTTVHKSMD